MLGRTKAGFLRKPWLRWTRLRHFLKRTGWRCPKRGMRAANTGAYWFTQVLKEVQVLVTSVSPNFSSESKRASRSPELTRLSGATTRSEEHTSELQSRGHLVCRLLLAKKKE